MPTIARTVVATLAIALLLTLAPALVAPAPASAATGATISADSHYGFGSARNARKHRTAWRKCVRRALVVGASDARLARCDARYGDMWRMPEVA